MNNQRPYLYVVTDRHELLAHVLVWHTATWETEKDSAMGESDAAYGMRPTADHEAREKACRQLFDQSKELNNSSLSRLASANYRNDNGESWTLLTIGHEGQAFATPHHAVELSKVTAKTNGAFFIVK